MKNNPKHQGVTCPHFNKETYSVARSNVITYIKRLLHSLLLWRRHRSAKHIAERQKMYAALLAERRVASFVCWIWGYILRGNKSQSFFFFVDGTEKTEGWSFPMQMHFRKSYSGAKLHLRAKREPQVFGNDQWVTQVFQGQRLLEAVWPFGKGSKQADDPTISLIYVHTHTYICIHRYKCIWTHKWTPKRINYKPKQIKTKQNWLGILQKQLFYTF